MNKLYPSKIDDNLKAELKNRKWIGIEIGPVDDIIDRFEKIDNDAKHLKSIRENLNCLFTKKTLQRRRKNGLWTSESVKKSVKEIRQSAE